MRTLFALIPMALISATGAAVQDSAADKADHFLMPYVEMRDFSGCVLVASHRQIIFRKCYGNANYELSVANTPQSKFHIASMTKMFTGAAIVLLERQGKVKFNDRLSSYIPNFPTGSKITILNLLEHTSGLPSYYSIPEYKDIKLKPISYEALIAIMRKKRLDFEPGTRSSYSDTGYVFLAYIIEKVTGKPYSQFVADEIFTPSGMHNSGTLVDTALIPNRSSGYQPWIGPYGMRNAPYYDKTIITGSGSLYSTIDDLYLWYQAVRDKHLFDITQLNYPYGWGQRKLDDKTFIEQSGRDPGYSGKMVAFLDQDLVVILLSNIEVAAYDEIAHGLEKLAFGGDPAPPAPRPSLVISRELAAQYAGRYQVAANSIMDVRVAEDSLFLRGPGGDYLPLEALTADTFFYKQTYTRIEFKRSNKGQIDAILWGGEFVCRRIANKPAPI